MLKEHKNLAPAKEKNYVFDLEEGDVASIVFPDFEDDTNSVLVYVFKHNGRLSMVALDKMKCFWSDIENNSLSVIRVLTRIQGFSLLLARLKMIHEPGEKLEVS